MFNKRETARLSNIRDLLITDDIDGTFGISKKPLTFKYNLQESK